MRVSAKSLHAAIKNESFNHLKTTTKRKTAKTHKKLTIVATWSDSDVLLCLQLLSKKLTCALHFIKCESIDHLCINPILRIGLILN